MIPQLELNPGEKPDDFVFKKDKRVCTLVDIYGTPTPQYNADLTNGFPGGFDEQLTGHGLDFTEYVCMKSECNIFYLLAYL